MAAAVNELAGRRVLVTGSTGFIGSHLVRALTAAGADVRRLTVDIRDRSAVAADVSAADPQLVFHLAAYGTTPVQRDETRMREVNIGGIENLWRALDRWPCRMVQTGTCAEYGAANGAVGESHACAPVSGYPRTMHEAVTVSRDRARQTGRELIVLRPFGPYGPGDRRERLVPFVIDGLLAGQPVPVTAGEQQRDYSYIDDQVRALILAATRQLPETARVYNVGSGSPIRVRTLVESIAAQVGGNALERVSFGAVPYRDGDPTDLFADITAARRDLGYEPAISLADGLARTVAWHKAARAGAA